MGIISTNLKLGQRVDFSLVAEDDKQVSGTGHVVSLLLGRDKRDNKPTVGVLIESDNPGKTGVFVVALGTDCVPRPAEEQEFQVENRIQLGQRVSFEYTVPPSQVVKGSGTVIRLDHTSDPRRPVGLIVEEDEDGPETNYPFSHQVFEYEVQPLDQQAANAA